MKFKNYKACIDYLFSLERAGIKYDLNNIRTLASLTGNPQRKFKSVHIAGTNGKGSVASVLSSILMEKGVKTGLYTSPHVRDFRERIRVNGKMIPKDYVVKFTEKYYNDIGKITPSFFEATTAMAFRYFAESGVEIAVVECGLGGRLDSTNILKPLVSVITSISIDHTEYLGNNLKSITYEKAGIIKKGVPCVIAKLRNESAARIKKTCRERKSPLTESAKSVTIKVTAEDESGLAFNASSEYYNVKDLRLPLAGSYQPVNMKTVFGVLDVLSGKYKIRFSESELRRGISKVTKNTGFDFRFRAVGKNPYVICDVSHNTEGIKNMRDTLKRFAYKNLYVIFGMMSDKEYRKCINELEKLNGFLILTKPAYKRAAEPEMLYAAVGNRKRCVMKPAVKDAYAYASSKAGKRDMILVTGSFFLVSDFLKIYKTKWLKP
ncbi:MAG: bifunctional folylpolyglutamate synthase/dihydrofolate synthase [Bacteroidetes bacterium]|nr:bifunctional folylpolyglutamate synthase/dihydrofolate synthase [Bacteroidota bacterium]